MKFEVSGEPIHTRTLSVALTQASGDSIQFRGDLLDLRKGGLMELAGVYSAAGIIHKMELRGEFALSTGEIECLAWDQSHVAHEANAATCGENCRDPMQRLEGLIGARFGDDFPIELKRHFGGVLGCSHITTLFREIGAFASAVRESPRLAKGVPPRRPGERIASRSLFLDGLLSSDSERVEVSIRIADLRVGGVDTNGDEVFRSLDELRLVASVALDEWRLESLQAGQRARSAALSDELEWRSRAGELVESIGQSLRGGMARFALERFNTSPEDGLLLSALLNLSPGMTQLVAALSDTPTRTIASGGSESFPRGGPCYMLRPEGPLLRRLISGPGAKSKEP